MFQSWDATLISNESTILDQLARLQWDSIVASSGFRLWHKGFDSVLASQNIDHNEVLASIAYVIDRGLSSCYEVEAESYACDLFDLNEGTLTRAGAFATIAILNTYWLKHRSQRCRLYSDAITQMVLRNADAVRPIEVQRWLLLTSLEWASAASDDNDAANAHAISATMFVRALSRNNAEA